MNSDRLGRPVRGSCSASWESGLGRLPLGRDVLAGTGHLHGVAVDAPDPAPALQPAGRAVGKDGPVGEVERLQGAEAALDVGLDQGPVLGVDGGDVALERPGEGLGSEAEDAVQLVGPVDLVVADVPLPDPDLGHGLGLAELVAGRVRGRPGAAPPRSRPGPPSGSPAAPAGPAASDRTSTVRTAPSRVRWRWRAGPAAAPSSSAWRNAGRSSGGSRSSTVIDSSWERDQPYCRTAASLTSRNRSESGSWTHMASGLASNRRETPAPGPFHGAAGTGGRPPSVTGPSDAILGMTPPGRNGYATGAAAARAQQRRPSSE